jgi:hypothetical protein
MHTEKISRGGSQVAGFALGATSYEEAINAVASNLQPVDVYGHAAGSDLTNEQLTAPMGNALSGCGVPNDMKVTVKVAVKFGAAVGVSVYTDPPNSRIASCVDRSVRSLRWPSSPNLDSFTTQY